MNEVDTLITDDGVNLEVAADLQAAGPPGGAGVIVAVTPNPGLDRTLEVGRLRRGELHRVARATVEPGGKGINVARVLRAHGLATQAVFPAGGAEGDALVAMLRHDIPVRCVAIAAPLRVNVAVVEPGGRVTKLNEEGPEGARAAVDTSGDALTAAPAAGPIWSSPTARSLEDAIGRRIETFGEAVAAARALRDGGARRVLASFGSGAILIDGDTALHGRWRLEASSCCRPRCRSGPARPLTKRRLGWNDCSMHRSRIGVIA